MNPMPDNLRALLDIQMQSIPIRNEAARVSASGAERINISIPLRPKPVMHLLRYVLPLSTEKNLELDAIGAGIYNLCDGQHTVEQIIDLHRETWRLSFFEARAMVLTFLRQLARRNVILFLTPES